MILDAGCAGIDNRIRNIKTKATTTTSAATTDIMTDHRKDETKDDVHHPILMSPKTSADTTTTTTNAPQYHHHHHHHHHRVQKEDDNDDEVEEQSLSSSSSSSLIEYTDRLVSTGNAGVLGGLFNNNNNGKKNKKKKMMNKNNNDKKPPKLGWLHSNSNKDTTDGQHQQQHHQQQPQHHHQQLFTSMEGLIWNADKIIDRAMRDGPFHGGINKSHFASCAGICIVSTVQVAISISGKIGMGIFMKHDCVTNTWSNPVACGLSGLGVGLALGATLKDAIIFMTDYEGVESFYQRGFRVGGKINLTLGIGRSAEGHIGTSPSGTSATYTIAYGHGLSAGASLDGDIIGPRHDINTAFYGGCNSNSSSSGCGCGGDSGGTDHGNVDDGRNKSNDNDNNNSNTTSNNRCCCNPAHIVDGTIPFPTDKITVIDTLKEKLTICAAAGGGGGGMMVTLDHNGEQQKTGRAGGPTARRGFKQHLRETAMALCTGAGPLRKEATTTTEELGRIGRRLTRTDLHVTLPSTTSPNKQQQQQDIDDDQFLVAAVQNIENQQHQATTTTNNNNTTMGTAAGRINTLMTSSLIVNVEPDWQSTREL